MYSTLARVASSPLFHCALLFDHTMAGSTPFTVYTMSPLRRSPQCTTVSNCRCPGSRFLHGPAYTLTLFLMEEDVVVAFPLMPCFLMRPFTRRFISPRLISWRSAVASLECSQSSSSLRASMYTAVCVCRFSAQQRAPTSHTAKSVAVTSAPYFTGLPRRSLSNLFVPNILRNFRTADLRPLPILLLVPLENLPYCFHGHESDGNLVLIYPLEFG